MKRLYQKIYLTIIASLLMVVLVAGGIWRFNADRTPANQAFEMAGELAGAALPPADAGVAAQQQAIEKLAQRLQVDFALFDAQRQPITATGAPLPPPTPRMVGGGWLYGPHGPAWGFELPDARWLVVRAPHRHRSPAIGMVLFLGTIALVIAACAFPVVRGLTRRLERLQAGVETLGAGNLAARVKVQGRDEVARLAASFNRAASRIEELVGAHRMLLANASHELRTPLSRIRLGIELLASRQEPKYKDELQRDIAELDFLIDEILLASRLDTAPALAKEPVDLLGLLAEECAHYDDCTLDGTPLTLTADARLLRRLIRNLLENAERHGRPPILVSLRRADGQAVLEVMDHGPGIPEAERERVFVPFQRLGGEAKGAGLGLSLVRQIARLHGGDAEVARGDGTHGFRVSLPMA